MLCISSHIPQSVRGAAEHHHSPVQQGPGAAGCEGWWPCRCQPYLDKHLAARRVVARPGGSAVHRHGLAVPGELQGALLPHQLLDHLQEQHWAEQDMPGMLVLSALADSPAEPWGKGRKAATRARKDGTGITRSLYQKRVMRFITTCTDLSWGKMLE